MIPGRIAMVGGFPVPPAQPTPASSPSVPPPQVAVAPQPPQVPIPISSVAQTAMGAGSAMAQQQEQLGLFGGAMSKMFNSPLIGTAVDRLIELSMRPEALTPRFGDTFISPLARATAGQQMERRAGAAAAAASEEEFMRARILAQERKPGQPLTSVANELLDRIEANRNGLIVLDNMKALAVSGNVGGGANVGLSAVKTFFRALNIDVEETDIEEYKKNRASYMLLLQEQRAFGTEASKQDYKIADRILSDPGIFNSPSELEAQLKPLVEKLTRANQQLIARATAFGYGDLASGNSKGPGSGVPKSANTPVSVLSQTRTSQ